VALHTTSVELSRAVIDEASAVVESEAILALSASICTKGGTTFNSAGTIDEGECSTLKKFSDQLIGNESIRNISIKRF
jgi:hypothetical protein